VETQSKRSILSLLVNKIKTSYSNFVEIVGREEMRTQLRKSFFTGLLVVIPISVTIYILVFLIELLNSLLPFSFLPYGTGIVLTIILMRFISSIPLVKNVYAAVKQIADAMLSSTRKNYTRVVLIEYPRKGIYTLAFVTGVSKGEVQAKTQQNVINLFVPTTPNPTSGFYLMVPESDVIDLDMSVENAFKLLISGGMVSSDNASNNPFNTPS
jgi:uncharacterized membrane protein